MKKRGRQALPVVRQKIGWPGLWRQSATRRMVRSPNFGSHDLVDTLPGEAELVADLLQADAL